MKRAIIKYFRDRRNRGRMVVRLTPMQSVPITTNVVISNQSHGEVYPIQHYVTKFVSDLRQVSGFFYGYSGVLHQ